MYNFFKFWFPVLVYSGMIFFVSSLSSENIPSQASYCDKCIHALEFMPFGFLFVRALSNTAGMFSYKKILFLSVVASFGYGVIDEYHQSFVSGRFSDFGDVIADVIGGTVGVGAYCLLIQLKKKIRFSK